MQTTDESISTVLPTTVEPKELGIVLETESRGVETNGKSGLGPNRIAYLDGLRGFASVGVYLWHTFLAFFPGGVDASVPTRAAWLEIWIYRSPLAIFFAGDFNVYIFFVLSGFVISVSFFRSKDPTLVKKGFLRRYVRLMPPAALTVLVTYVLLSDHLMFNTEAGAVASSWWLHLNWSDVTLTFQNAVWQAFYGIWFTQLGPAEHINSNLGTLFIELIGSYTIFAYLTIAFVLKWSFNKRMLACAGMIAGSFFMANGEPHFAIFFTGMAIADIYVNRAEFIESAGKFSVLWIVLGVFFGSVNIGNLGSGPYGVFSFVSETLHLQPLIYPWALGAVFMMLGALTFQPFQKVLETRFAQITGEYSFALYLAHTVFIGSFTSGAFVLLSRWGYFNYAGNVCVAFIVGLPVLAAWVYVVRRVDIVATAFSRRV